MSSLSPCWREFHQCLTARGDEPFELADAVLCADGTVRTLAGLSLGAEHRRGHGALYDAVNCGEIAVGRLRRSLAGLPLPRAADGWLVLAADVSNWLRPGAATSPGRLFCHVYGRGKGQAQMIPGWPYSVIAALESAHLVDRAVLDAVRLGPGDDETEVTAGQLRDVVTRLIEGGHWAAADRWTWLITAVHAQLRLARPLADDLRLPWERPAPPGRLTPARVRRGFRNIRAHLPCPAGAPKPGKPGKPGLGRPPGSRNRRPAPHYDVRKTTKRKLTLKASRERAG